MTTGVIMVTLGGPRSLEEIPEFIKNFIGRALPPPALQGVIERYRIIGGCSPLTRITEEQAHRLNKLLGPGYLCLPGFRYSRPSIEDAIASLAAAEVSNMLLLPLSPFFASVTTGNYIQTAEACGEKTAPGIPMDVIHSWHREPQFIGSWVEKIRAESFDENAWYLFSAHSLPLKYSSEPYRRQIEETVAMIVLEAGIKRHSIGWQSIPANAQEPWITPTVEERIDEIIAAGTGTCIQVPVGFTADHIETLYDIDITHRRYAGERGLSFRRLSSLNAGEAFIQALKQIVIGFAKDKQ